MQIAYVHFYTRDAAETSGWFIRNLDFQAIAKSLNNHTHTEVIASNSVFILISSPLNSLSPVYRYLKIHPSGVADVAFKVSNLETIITKAIDRGVKILQYPRTIQTSWGAVRRAKIAGWDSLEHSLIETASNEPISFLPVNIENPSAAIAHHSKAGIVDIDHIVLNVAAGKLNSAATWYQTLFSLQVRQTFKIQTPRSGLYSQALADSSGKVQFNLNEPTSNNSQIQEFLNLNNGSGIQHLALRCDNLIDAVEYMRSHEVAFLSTPKAYYRQIEPYRNRLLVSKQEWQAIEAAEILIDWQRDRPQSLLMQTFSQPIFERPTFFLEFIERRQQARGFGEGNFRALFEAVEREQIKR